MKTLQDEWREYRDAVYPKGIPANQNLELHQAFFAGALVVLNLAIQRAGELSEEGAFKQIGNLIREAEQTCSQRAYTLKNRN